MPDSNRPKPYAEAPPERIVETRERMEKENKEIKRRAAESARAWDRAVKKLED